MTEFVYTVKDKIGLHARPAGMIAKKASQYESTITLTNLENAKTADAKKLFALMNLMIKHGNQIRISCTGDDCEEAMSAMKQCIEECL